KELEIKKENRKIDNLTGLEDLSEFIKNITSDDANKAEFSVLILLDIDDLQNINELYGADSSNEVIVSFSKLLSSFAQELSYKIYRANGSQFILLDQVKYIDTEKYEDEFNTLQKRIKEFSVYLNEAGKEIDINATIGMSLGEDRIFEHADMALKSAKDKYQSYAVYNTQIDTTREMEKKIEWQCRIILALKNDCIVPVYHPIVDIDGNIVKYEALMRLVEVEDGEEKLFSPVHFLEIALESKYYNALSSMMIHKVLDSLKAHQHTISINLTYTDIQNKVFINTILERIKNEHIGERVIVEILESESIKDYELLKDIIIKFRQIGVKIAIDDFGSGFSNFKHILEIRPDYIKIDGSLIENIDIDSHAYILTNGITTFFHQLGVIMIAEYVHTKEIYEILKQMNMDQYQGYYFSEPVRYI
ncbi:MAG: GGDEF domain-containing phosphodiesterase, partial [Campylobacterota bacterium]|nr:GGDEF domain-containing phosphodiesterase [Campylobacterota bacterium]